MYRLYQKQSKENMNIENIFKKAKLIWNWKWFCKIKKVVNKQFYNKNIINNIFYYFGIGEQSIPNAATSKEVYCRNFAQLLCEHITVNYV